MMGFTDVTRAIADCRGEGGGEGIADSAWAIAACFRGFAVWECQTFALGDGGGSWEGEGIEMPCML